MANAAKSWPPLSGRPETNAEGEDPQRLIRGRFAARDPDGDQHRGRNMLAGLMPRNVRSIMRAVRWR